MEELVAMNEVVAVMGLGKRFGSVEALRDVSFALHGPQIIGILGPNGAGKTSLLDLLEGLSRPSQGQIRLFGQPLEPGRYPRHRVGVVLQKEFVLDGILVGEYAELFAAIYGVADGQRRILESAGLVERTRVPLARISGGEAQRLYLAAAAVHRPELLFLDEPTAHLDPAHKRELGQLLRHLSANCTVVITTHDLHEADSLCDEVVFLVDGEVKAHGPRQDLLAASSRDSLEEAFFHYCEVRIDRRGERQ